MGNSSVTEDGNSDVPGQVRSIDTHVGPLEVRVFGDIDAVATGAATPVICFHGAKFSLLPEWIPIANALAETSKFVVVIPNFHSNSVTKPTIVFGGMQPPDLCKIVKEKAVIMGKSWGGHMSYTYAALQPETVLKLVLQAPAWTTPERVAAVAEHKIPLLLCWARNDNMMSYSNVKTWEAKYEKEKLQVYSAEKGGHAVTPEYQEPIMKFLQEA